MLVDNRQRVASRVMWSLILGFFLGGLLTLLSDRFLPESAARDFLITSVAAEVGPFHLDLVAVALTLGPVVFTLNVLTLVGVGLVAMIARSLI